MSPVREKSVNIIESLPYDIDKEIFKRDTFNIFQDVTQRYVDTYGVDDLSEEDKKIIDAILENKNHQTSKNAEGL